MHRPPRIEPGPGQESVWDYPRPPRLELSNSLIEIVLDTVTIVRTTEAWRVLETSHPPVYYLPPGDILPEVLRPSGRRPSVCEFKGVALYFDVEAGDTLVTDAAWAYPRPNPAFSAITDHVAFYSHAMDACYVDGELVRAQPGGFYGGWITANIVGPFKGTPNTYGW